MSLRAEFSKATKAAAFLRCAGVCECGCAMKIGIGDAVEYDHYPIPASMGGPATLENCRVLIKKHHRHITATKDVPAIAKSTRLAEKRMGLRPKRSTFRGSKKFNGDVTWKT